MVSSPEGSIGGDDKNEAAQKMHLEDMRAAERYEDETIFITYGALAACALGLYIARRIRNKGN